MILSKLKKDLRTAQRSLNSFIKKQEKLVDNYSNPINSDNILECPLGFMYSNFAYANDIETTDKIHQIYYDTFYTRPTRILVRGQFTKEYQKRTQKNKGIFGWSDGSEFIELDKVVFEDSAIDDGLRNLEKKVVSETQREVDVILNQISAEYESYIGAEVDIKTKPRTHTPMIFTRFRVTDAPLNYDERRVGISFLDQDENEIVMYDTKRIRAIWS